MGRIVLSLSPSKAVTGSLAVVIVIIGFLSTPECHCSLVRNVPSKDVPYQLMQNIWDTDGEVLAAPMPSHSMRKREAIQATTSATTTNGASSKIKRFAVPLNDSHNQLLVFWAGEDVILCLAKDINSNSSSTLWISRDYGGNFSNATSLLVQNSGGIGNGSVPHPVLEGFFNHPSHNGHFAFTDTRNKIIFTTRNYGAEFTANKVDFVPDELLFDPHSEVNIVAYEKSNKRQMWVSIDFGKSWTKVQEHVKLLAWDESVTPANLYLQREEPSQSGENTRSVILKSDSLFLDPKSTEIIITGVEEFEIKDDFMFATRQKEKDVYELLISYNKSEFRTAVFPVNQPRHFFIADVSDDGQIFVCVVQNESISNLYIGSFPKSHPDEKENPTFSLSLERILYFKPNVTWSESWLNEVSSDEPFVDLHHVEGLRGVYIASQLKPSTVANEKFHMNEVISLITFDQGAEWQVLTPPEFEHDGRPIYCQYKSGGNCSLHISQRLSELYPRTRAVPILSKKSAVGMVLATGTVNTTLKGHLGVYLSTDGAVTWRQILQGNYLYAFGDHGGIMVATKMYRIGDDTNELIYSIDEGETWEKYVFYEEKVRVMGLMTEPGENTTTFFIFGSLAPTNPSSNFSGGTNPRHTWVLIKVDFQDVFERNCNSDDYKSWSPWDTELDSPTTSFKTARHCLLGRKQIYQRRIPNHKCYNGRGYIRPVTERTCACERSDFECDFGYVVDPKSLEKDCIRDNSETSPGVKPEWCKPAEKFYNKTRGYRKIPGDTCEEGFWVDKYLPELIPCEIREEPEFLLVAKRDSVLRIDLNHYERVETLPLARVQAIIAVDFNLKNNCIFWSDVQHKTIMKLHLDGKSIPEVLVSAGLTSVEGLAFDWMSQLLYFTDGGGSKIEVVHVAPHPEHARRMRKRLLKSPDVEKPRGIAVHPSKGFIFWTDWSTQNPSIGRAHLDGSNTVKIIQNDESHQQLTLKWPNGITIDFKNDRLLWVDAHQDRIMTSDFNGEKIKIVLESDQRISHPFAVGIYKNSLYWDDWTTRGIYTAELVSGTQDNYVANPNSTFQIKGNLPRLMDLKVYGTGMQGGDNICSSEAKSNCSHLCFLHPNETVSCLCPDGFVMQNNSCVCPDGKSPNATTGSCESKCEEGRTFRCRTHPDYCIIKEWRCDSENDCGDGSDEEDCGAQECEDPAEFKCKKSGRCIPQSFVCDYDHDCGFGDLSDEEDCKGKNRCDPVKHFQCGNGRCILKSWQCDEDDDCLDNSDEQNCTDALRNVTFSCPPTEWKCPNENKCLSPDWLCDFDSDCEGGEDEKDCAGRTCPEWKFACNKTGHCIMKTWECDGEQDCTDGSDEHENCPPPSQPPPPPESPFLQANCSQMSQMFECSISKECIPVFWKCDQVKDCQDGTDELGCQSDPDKPTNATLAPPVVRCETDHWRCDDGSCIASYSVCDGFPDCSKAEDEQNCHNIAGGGCPPAMRRCGDSRACIPDAKWCDGRADCPNKVDEQNCGIVPVDPKCNSGSFKCDDQQCMPLVKLCNGIPDCLDLTDEDPNICKKYSAPVYQVDGISLSEVDATWFEVDWWLSPLPKGKQFNFIASRCEVDAQHCLNFTTTLRKYKFEGLSPYHKYTVTVYVSQVGDAHNSKVYPPYKYLEVLTEQAEASAPLSLVVKQNTTDNLILTWKRPHTPNGKITSYKVYFQPPVSGKGVDVWDAEELVISNKQSNPLFVPGVNYTFWVTAVNGYGEGNSSEKIMWTYNGEVALISELSYKGLTGNSVAFLWEPANNNADSYVALLETNTPGSLYTFRNRSETSKRFIEFTNLSSGTRYRFTVIPKYKGTHGATKSLTFTTKGSQLPRVEDFRVTAAQSGAVKLTWKPVKISGKVTYGIYYGKTVDEITQRRAQIVTELHDAEASNLEACENYLFDIGLVVPGKSFGPLTEKPLQVITRMNPQSPPKGVRVERLDSHGEALNINVSWKAPCAVMDKAVSYNIILLEMTQNRSYGLSNLSYSNQSELSWSTKLQYGGHYQLTVSTNVAGGKPSAPVYFDGPPIPFPEKIRECSDCNPPILYWSEPTLPLSVTSKGNQSYVVYLSDDQDFANPRRHVTNSSSFKFTDILDDGIYYAAVTVMDAEGLESPMSTPIVIQHQANGSSPIVLPGSSALAITLSVLVVIILLVAVLAVFIVRHKRLQTSFLNFASSHYSSSSGAATFQQTMEQDSPVIRGFSDDEPLLVA